MSVTNSKIGVDAYSQMLAARPNLSLHVRFVNVLSCAQRGPSTVEETSAQRCRADKGPQSLQISRRCGNHAAFLPMQFGEFPFRDSGNP